MNNVASGSMTVAGVRSPYLHSGPASAEEAVVFVHGNPGSGKDWRYLLGQVGRFSRGVALDMPGYGAADKPADFDYTIEGYARHLAGALEALGIRRAHLVLHDFGGPWGIAWAANHPHNFASVTFINAGILPGYRWHYLARIWRAPLLGEIFMATVTRPFFHLSLKHGNPRGLPKAYVNQMFDDFDRATRQAVLKLYRATPEQRLNGDLARRLPLPPRPALVIWGSHDPYLPARYADEQAAFFPGAKVVKLDRSGHWPFADDPERVAGELVPFLQQQLQQQPQVST